MTGTPADAGGGVRLRPLRWWDLDAVLPLERELFGATAWTAEVFWSELAQGESRWYVVAQEAADGPRDAGPRDDGTYDAAPAGGGGAHGAVLGYAGLLAGGGAEGDVQTIAVAPAAQGRGIGAALLRALLAEAARRGVTSVMLEVRADNAAAVRLYERHGFERIAVRRRYYQPGDVDACVMRLRPLRAAGSGEVGDTPGDQLARNRP